MPRHLSVLLPLERAQVLQTATEREIEIETEAEADPQIPTHGNDTVNRAAKVVLRTLLATIPSISLELISPVGLIRLDTRTWEILQTSPALPSIFIPLRIPISIYLE